MLENKKLFQYTIALVSAGLALACLMSVRNLLNGQESWSLTLLFIGALSGFYTTLNLFIPLILSNIFPKLDK